MEYTFMDAYTGLLGTYKTDIKYQDIEIFLNFVKKNKLGGNNDYRLSEDYIKRVIETYKANHKTKIDYKKIFISKNILKLIGKQILMDASTFLNNRFVLSHEYEKNRIDLEKVINLKNDLKEIDISNPKEAYEFLTSYIDKIDFEELDENAEDTNYKNEYSRYFAFKFLVSLIEQRLFKKKGKKMNEVIVYGEAAEEWLSFALKSMKERTGWEFQEIMEKWLYDYVGQIGFKIDLADPTANQYCFDNTYVNGEYGYIDQYDLSEEEAQRAYEEGDLLFYDRASGYCVKSL